MSPPHGNGGPVGPPLDQNTTTEATTTEAVGDSDSTPSGRTNGGNDAPLNSTDAERLTTKIQLRLGTIADNVDAVVPMIKQARAGNAHEALGYRSWTEYVADKFGGSLGRLGKAERGPLVELLSEQGMSTRAIASVAGVSNVTISRDLAPVTSVTPAEQTMADATGDQSEQALDQGRADGDLSQVNVVTKRANNVVGVDGKTYRPSAKVDAIHAAAASPSVRKQRRSSLPDSYYWAVIDLGRVLARLKRLHEDDRFQRNQGILKDKFGHQVEAATHLLEGIDSDLSGQGGSHE